MPNQHHIEVRWEEYPDAALLPEQPKMLMVAAKQALDNAYAPYSNFHVAAALLLDNEEIISGTNYENAAYPMCLCAERSAIAAAVSCHPKSIITHMAITVRNPKKTVVHPAAPCGACRQVLVETELRQEHDIKIILQGETGAVLMIENAKSLLPFYFDGSML